MTSSGGLAPTSEDKLADDLQQVVLRQLEQDALVLPALPAVVVKAVGLLRADEPDLRVVARILEPDPVVTARVLRLANSPTFRGAQRVSTIAQAVTRLGVRELVAVLLELSAQRVFASADPAINRACRQLWQHSVATALVARDVAAQIDWTDTAVGAEAPETAYIGGLLHDIGKPVMAGLLLDAEKRLRGRQTRTWLTPQRWIKVVSASHRRLGLALARAWELPEAVVGAVERAHSYDRDDRLTVANVVVLANALAKREGLYVGEVDAAGVEAEIEHGRTLFLLSSQTVAELCDSLGERVKLRLT